MLGRKPGVAPLGGCPAAEPRPLAILLAVSSVERVHMAEPGLQILSQSYGRWVRRAVCWACCRPLPQNAPVLYKVLGPALLPLRRGRPAMLAAVHTAFTGSLGGGLSGGELEKTDLV